MEKSTILVTQWNEKEHINDLCNKDEYQKHSAKWKKPEPKEKILYDSTYKKFPNRQKESMVEKKKKTSGCLGREGVRTAMGVPAGMMEMSCILTGMWATWMYKILQTQQMVRSRSVQLTMCKSNLQKIVNKY